MELLAGISKLDHLQKVQYSGIDGIIFGSFFSLKNSFPIDTFLKISEFCDRAHLKKYIVLDSIVSEEEKGDLYNYFDLLLRLKVDGIYFHDLAVYDVARSFERTDLLIYDGQTMMTNSLDIAFFLDQDIDVVLGRELTLEEIIPMIAKNPGRLDMQVFGRYRLSYSKRNFLSNYYKEIGKDDDPKDKKTFTLREETRDYYLPIIENEYGTQIYTDFVFEMYREYPVLAPHLKRAIVDDAFISTPLFTKVIHDYRRITEENVEFLRESLYKDFPDEGLSSGYFYEKGSTIKNVE